MGGTELKEGEEDQVNVMTRGEGEWKRGLETMRSLEERNRELKELNGINV